MVERWSTRRARRDRRSEIETVVLDTTERLLGEVALHDLEVKQILAEAGISRTSFYQYFSSKFDVVAALVGRTVAETFEAVQEWSLDDGRPPEARLLAGLRAVADVWHRHRNIYNSAAESWFTDPELARLWRSLNEQWALLFTDIVRRDVQLGRAHVEGDLRSLLAALAWGSQHVFYVATSGTSAGLPDIESAVDALHRIWTSTIYGRSDERAGAAPA